MIPRDELVRELSWSTPPCLMVDGVVICSSRPIGRDLHLTRLVRGLACEQRHPDLGLDPSRQKLTPKLDQRASFNVGFSSCSRQKLAVHPGWLRVRWANDQRAGAVAIHRTSRLRGRGYLEEGAKVKI